MRHLFLSALFAAIAARYSFSLSHDTFRRCGREIKLPTSATYFKESKSPTSPRHMLTYPKLIGSALLIGCLAFGGPVRADEIGIEKEAPTVFTGENVMICKRRGLLGACLETEVRTEENDNDKARKYFRDPTALLKEKEALMRENNDDGNALIQKLRKQSRDNQEKNDLYVQRKTFENDQSGYMGPFDRQVLIMNTDGKTFTVLENPQAMRLKDSGFIVDRRFVKQPTEEELEQALVADSSGLAGVIQSIFGGGTSE